MKKFEMPELQVVAFEEEPVMTSGNIDITDGTTGVGSDGFGASGNFV